MHISINWLSLLNKNFTSLQLFHLRHYSHQTTFPTELIYLTDSLAFFLFSSKLLRYTFTWVIVIVLCYFLFFFIWNNICYFLLQLTSLRKPCSSSLSHTHSWDQFGFTIIIFVDTKANEFVYCDTEMIIIWRIKLFFASSCLLVTCVCFSFCTLACVDCTRSSFENSITRSVKKRINY